MTFYKQPNVSKEVINDQLKKFYDESLEMQKQKEEQKQDLDLNLEVIEGLDGSSQMAQEEEKC